MGDKINDAITEIKTIREEQGGYRYEIREFKAENKQLCYC